MCPVDLIIFFDVSNETLEKRLLGRAAAAATQRADDNLETIKRRIKIFNVKNGEIVNHYKDKVVRVSNFTIIIIGLLGKFVMKLEKFKERYRFLKMQRIYRTI